MKMNRRNRANVILSLLKSKANGILIVWLYSKSRRLVLLIVAVCRDSKSLYRLQRMICIEYRMYRLSMNIIDGPVIEKPTYPLRAQGTTKPKTSMLTCHFCRCLLPKNSGHKAQAWFLSLIRTGDWSQTVQLSSKLKKSS